MMKWMKAMSWKILSALKYLINFLARSEINLNVKIPLLFAHRSSKLQEGLGA